MSILDEIKPSKRQRFFDLAQAAGVDVSDWSNYKKGTVSPAANPKYCYEWALVQPQKVVVLNLWHESMREEEGQLKHPLNLRDTDAVNEKNFTRRARRQRMEDAISLAHKSGLPIRVIVLDGERRREAPVTKGAVVAARLLDPVPWGVESFDYASGDIILARGISSAPYVDQFSLPVQPSDGPLGKREVNATVRNRSAEVRTYVLLRAQGKCEFCKMPGFKLGTGSVYLESHHVVPLAEGGSDSVCNVAALCPNHHREAHYGAAAIEIRNRLLQLLNPS